MTKRHSFDEQYATNDLYQRYNPIGKEKTSSHPGYKTQAGKKWRIQKGLPGFSLLDYAFRDAAYTANHQTNGEPVGMNRGYYSWKPMGVTYKPARARVPHGLINNAREKVGMKGEILLGYVKWVADRIRKFGEEDYNPILHFDTYGRIGEVFDNDLERVRDYLLKLEDAANPYRLQIEMPIEAGSKIEEMSALKRLKKMLTEAGSCVKLVVDEWANTFEEIKEWADSQAADIIQIKPTDIGSVDKIIRAVLYCKKRKVGAYLGGTCNETDKSAQVCAHIALATKPHQMLAKPGMAVDEGMMIVHNEMRRTLALIDSRKKG